MPFARALDLNTSLSPAPLLLADADGDGLLDLITANAASSTIAVLHNVSFSPSQVDCNRNALLDACELKGGELLDADGNGIPDVCERPPIRRGDATADGVINITDAIAILEYVFLGGRPPACPGAANTNGDRYFDIADAVYLLNFIFYGGRAPPAPDPDCPA